MNIIKVSQIKKLLGLNSTTEIIPLKIIVDEDINFSMINQKEKLFTESQIREAINKCDFLTDKDFLLKELGLE